MQKTIFALSDIHGHFQEMQKALHDVGYNEDDPSHLLIVCGDLFDRGIESVAIFKYLYRLTQEKKAIVIKGNHDTMFQEFLEGSNPYFNWRYNGMRTTFDDFWGTSNSLKNMIELKELGNINYDDFEECFNVYINRTRNNINNKYSYLLDWLKNMPYYYETKKYIFTHGSIDTKVNDWHHPTKQKHKYCGWEACTWDDGSFFGESICNTNKIVVIGHFATNVLREIYYNEPKDNSDYSILKREDGRIIALDSCTIVSKKVNVLKVDDFLI